MHLIFSSLSREENIYFTYSSDINGTTVSSSFHPSLSSHKQCNGLASHQASSSTVCAPPLMSDPPNPPSAPKAPPPPLPAFWRKSGTSCWASDRTLTRSDAMEVSKSAPPSKNDVALPTFPTLPVLPILWTYSSIWLGRS